ncbi:hypothetical protein KC323_g52 [Hortaea werneckii]|nr:hypothetical protein KC323_g52 [Hortaea werneckii]
MPYFNPLGSTKRFARILCESVSCQSAKKSNDAKIHGLLTNPDSGWRLGVECMTPTADLCRVWVSGGATGSLAPCNLHLPRSAHIGLSTSSQRHCTRPPTPPDLLLAVVSPDDARRQSHASPEHPRGRDDTHSVRRRSFHAYITLATFTVSSFCSRITLFADPSFEDWYDARWLSHILHSRQHHHYSWRSSWLSICDSCRCRPTSSL